MKKKLTYLMLPAVIAIWGIIFYRIFFANAADDVPAMNERTTVIDSKDGNAVPDTFSIIASYRDPFLGKMVSNEVHRNTQQTVNSEPKQIKPVPVQTPWPSVSYSGMIKNRQSSVQLAMLQVNGQSYTVKAGEAIEGVKVTKIYRDSVEIIFGAEKKIFKK
jgi:type II secretory pathway component PulC